jgi:hypothetical protein
MGRLDATCSAPPRLDTTASYSSTARYGQRTNDENARYAQSCGAFAARVAGTAEELYSGGVAVCWCVGFFPDAWNALRLRDTIDANCFV